MRDLYLQHRRPSLCLDYLGSNSGQKLFSLQLVSNGDKKVRDRRGGIDMQWRLGPLVKLGFGSMDATAC